MSEYSEKKQENRRVSESQNTTQTQPVVSYNSLPPFQLSTEKLKLDVSTKKMPDTINPVQAFGLVDKPTDTTPVKHWTPEILQRQQKENKTGLPDNLKSGIENLSGHSMDDVKVHYNSSKPTQLNAHAYAQGTDIHLASGQEKHLPHEAWHVVQQKEGRVKPTMQMQGVNINDDTGLEKEADVMGGKALQMKQENSLSIQKQKPLKQVKIDNGNTNQMIVQRGKKNPKDEEERKRRLAKLRDTYTRNKIKKAKPKNRRKIFRHQRRLNYNYSGYDIAKEEGNSPSNALIPHDPKLNSAVNPKYDQFHFGGMGGYYRKGWGNQPFLYLDKDEYDDNLMPSDYDAIIAEFSGNDAEIALSLLSIIEKDGQSDRSKLGQAKSLFIFLTQFIEPHNTRIPGSDKLARALLRRIALGQLTFKAAFNRKDGLFVSAWAKKANKKIGGQQAARVLFGVPPKKSDKYTMEQLEEDIGEDKFDDLLKTTDYYSDASDDEEEDDLGMGLEKEDGIQENIVKEINENLKILGLDERIKSAVDVLFLSELIGEIKKARKRLLIQHHPDKGGSRDSFEEVQKAYKLLSEWIDIEDITGFEQKFTDKSINDGLQQYGCTLKKVKGDGNCFYNAIIDQLNYRDGNAPNVDALRGRIAQLIIDNTDTFQIFVQGNVLNTIVNDILTSHSWNNMGGDFAPQLIATVLGRPVRIIGPNGATVIPPRNDLNLNANNTYLRGTSELTIVYNGSTHYDSTIGNQSIR